MPMVIKMNEEEKENREECINEDCENPTQGGGHDCGSYGTGHCEECYESYSKGEWEPEIDVRDDA